MLLNFGCHPEVLGPDNSKITADYIYFSERKLKREKVELLSILTAGLEISIHRQ
jgi:hypothetical protein